MCGIIAIAGQYAVLNDVIASLEKLEYRGYDSAGIAAFDGRGIYECKSLGRIEKLKKKLQNKRLNSRTIIGHTRWATHGKVSIENTHPIVRANIAVVHNGTIDNHFEIKKWLLDRGVEFSGETDTEVLAALIEYELQSEEGLLRAITVAIKRLQGNFAFALISAQEPDKIVVAKSNMNLVLGKGGDFMAVSSDSSALPSGVAGIAYLENESIAVISSKGFEIFDFEGKVISIDLKQVDDGDDALRLGVEDNMRREIESQPGVVRDIINYYIDKELIKGLDFNILDEIFIIACGSSYFAALTGKYWIEEIAGIKVTVTISSEFNVRPPIQITNNSVYIFISQSGETADTFSALRYVKQNRPNARTVGIVNNMHSSISRNVENLIQMMAGREVAVAATKTFYSQITILFLLALSAGLARKSITREIYNDYVKAICAVPYSMECVIAMRDQINSIVMKGFLKQKSILYFGKGILYPIVMEGALKIKEIAYIPAEGIPSGELKHGTIALIDDDVMAVSLVNNGKLFKKTITSLEEVLARSSNVMLITDSLDYKNDSCNWVVRLPSVGNELLAPFTFTLAMQLIAYNAATAKGCDIDRPRNLAKSVTVE
ncbi:Glutamine--fructose-6-phosphate aminotransferase [Candidatus Cyrtobacter comes]|uniref:Glutamine--fructose-6-phosphate aminotransferase [isomerizing] n=1 Tax=Candidatus Cyrtobacter comes TaxID=675776 RepID=A0ABU5L7Q2_9RICK|nr:glutamine--fructose-6-phosphate transaminase (isomerizing) [Candidatus Cyrtobacter comes]MDZ5762148.1 Glutamine--fructose-6-phosphate aminotransferase [Candidatus Cyrtobacter comes]